MGKVIDNSLLMPYEALREVGDEKIDEALRLLRDVKAKKKVDLKKFTLSQTASISIENKLALLKLQKKIFRSFFPRPPFVDLILLTSYERRGKKTTEQRTFDFLFKVGKFRRKNELEMSLIKQMRV